MFQERIRQLTDATDQEAWTDGGKSVDGGNAKDKPTKSVSYNQVDQVESDPEVSDQAVSETTEA